MEIIKTLRPRNVKFLRAAGILYGDWGTSKAYVLGLAFALAGYSSFWYIFAVGILTLLVGINYIKICEFYPHGGGVYSSARGRSKVVSLIGAFFLISDYLITAALSSLSAFHYLGVPNESFWAIVAIIVIGMLNFLGPKHSGLLSLTLALPTILAVILLSLVSIPFVPEAINNLDPVSSDWTTNWEIFVGIIVALSGIESIANTTGSMKLDRGATYEKPSVIGTSTPAILMVMLEVCIFTTFLGLMMNALPGLEVHNGEVSAPGYPNVRDSMLRYMGEIFGGWVFGPVFGYYFSLFVSVVFALLLLSAVNTAIIALVSLLFVMSRDDELPELFQKLNRFGVPHYSTLIAFTAPVFILMIINDIAGLASLYAIGFVGAITINLGATSTNSKLPLKGWERTLMFCTFLIMLLIEITLFIDKPHARGFVVAVIGIGLLLRAIVSEQKEKVLEPVSVAYEGKPPILKLGEGGQNAMMVAVTGVGKHLDYALEEAQNQNKPLYVLFVREQRHVAERDDEGLWARDKGARAVIDYVFARPANPSLGFLYTVASNTGHSIIEIATMKKVQSVVLGKRKKGAFYRLRDSMVREVSRKLPKNINLILIDK